LGPKKERVCTRLDNLHTEYDISCMPKGLYGVSGNFALICFFFISIPFIPLLFLYAGSLPGTAGSEFSGSTPSMLYHVSTPSSNDNSSFKENQQLK
jgi:hypothetical protein